MAEPRPSHLADEDESYFISMTDLMVGMLFVFIILLMSFALNLKEASVERSELEADIQLARQARSYILGDIRNRLQDRGVRVLVDEANGILRLPEEEFSFEKAHAEISEPARVKLRSVAAVLLEVLPCFATSPLVRPPDCPIDYTNAQLQLEAVFVEGHTDEDRMDPRAKYKDNLELSALRSVNTYREFMDSAPRLRDLFNSRHEQLIGVSGYGENRPLPGVSQASEIGKRLNRRIDLRFLMATPRSADEVVESVQNRLGGDK